MTETNARPMVAWRMGVGMVIARMMMLFARITIRALTMHATRATEIATTRRLTAVILTRARRTRALQMEIHITAITMRQPARPMIMPAHRINAFQMWVAVTPWNPVAKVTARCVME